MRPADGQLSESEAAAARRLLALSAAEFNALEPLDLADLDRSDRGLIFLGLMRRLGRADLEDFVRWCCRRVCFPGGHPIVMAGRINEFAPHREAWLHWLNLVGAYKLSITKSRAELERRVRKFGKPLQFRAFPLGGDSWRHS